MAGSAPNPNVLSAKDRLNQSIVARSPRLIPNSSSGGVSPGSRGSRESHSPLITPKDGFIGTDVADRYAHMHMYMFFYKQTPEWGDKQKGSAVVINHIHH